MNIYLNPDLQARLARVAAQRGRDPEILARETIERFVDYDDWFIEEVEKVWRKLSVAKCSPTKKSAHG